MGRQRSAPSGFHSWCKPCINENARAKRVRHDTPAMRRKWLLSQRYRMTPEQADAMLIAQSGRCAICELPMHRPCLDHNHAIGKLRALLCHSCNVKLHVVEDWAFRERAMRYLLAHK